MKKMFVIRPVRGITDAYKEAIEMQVEFYRKRYDVYDPIKDTNQDDSVGLRICQDNCQAIKDADVVAVMWDGKSTGCLFDLGMAFALGKPIVPVIGYFPTTTDGKSFPNMIYAWQERGKGPK